MSDDRSVGLLKRSTFAPPASSFPPPALAVAAFDEHGARIERLIARLPPNLQRATRWLRQPSSRWARIPSGVLLMIGGLLWILPLLGLWMLPLGLLLLAEDVPVLMRLRARALAALDRRYPHWFAPSPSAQHVLPPLKQEGS
jgi:hypothetical protein